MPHAFYTIDCQKCGIAYCPVCKDKCPDCGEVDIADEKTMRDRRQMKAHMNRGQEAGKYLKIMGIWVYGSRYCIRSDK